MAMTLNTIANIAEWGLLRLDPVMGATIRLV